MFIVVKIRHPTSLQLLFDFPEAFLDLFAAFRLFALTLLLLVLVNRDKYADGLSCKLVPALPTWMRLHEHRDDIILRKCVLFIPFFASVFVLLFVFSLEFFCAAAVVARKPSNVRVKVPHVGKQLPNRIFCHIREFFTLSIFVEFDNCDYRHIVEVKNAVDFDPLEPDEMVVAGVG